MDKSCDISVVIPTYNRARLLERAIVSVLQQSMPPAEVIIVDDGSKDDTAQVCERFGKQVTYTCQQNAGASVARNTGIQRVRFPWTAFLDSDDVWMPTHLERVHHGICRTKGQAHVYFSDMQFDKFHGDTTLWDHCGFACKAEFLYVEDATAWMLMKRQPTML